MDIRFPTINYMTLTGYRKLFKYATMTGATSGKTILPGQYSSYFDPPLPVLTRPEFNPPPPDAFTYNPGPLTGTDLHLQNELSIRYGYPTYPSPWFSVNGQAILRETSCIPRSVMATYIVVIQMIRWVEILGRQLPIALNLPLTRNQSATGSV